MASTAALQVQVHEAGGLQRRQTGTAFADLLTATKAVLEAFLAGKSWVFITELDVLPLWVNSSPVMLGCQGNKNLNLSSECCIIVTIRHFFQINSSLSAPTKIEELTAGSDEKTQRSPAANPILGSIPGGAALCFFV